LSSQFSQNKQKKLDFFLPKTRQGATATFILTTNPQIFLLTTTAAAAAKARRLRRQHHFLSLKIISKLFFISKMSPVLLAFIRMIACQL